MPVFNQTIQSTGSLKNGSQNVNSTCYTPQITVIAFVKKSGYFALKPSLEFSLETTGNKINVVHFSYISQFNVNIFVSHVVSNESQNAQMFAT